MNKQVSRRTPVSEERPAPLLLLQDRIYAQPLPLSTHCGTRCWSSVDDIEPIDRLSGVFLNSVGSLKFKHGFVYS